MISIAVSAIPALICFDCFVERCPFGLSLVVQALLCAIVLLFFIPVLEDTVGKLFPGFELAALLLMFVFPSAFRLAAGVGMLIICHGIVLVPDALSPAFLVSNLTLWNSVRIISKTIALVLFLCFSRIVAWLSSLTGSVFVLGLLVLGSIAIFVDRTYVSFMGMASMFGKKVQCEIRRASSMMKYGEGAWGEGDNLLSEAGQEVLDRILKLIVDQKMYLKQGITVEEIARLCYTNVSYVSKLIKVHSGTGVVPFINKCRVEHAATLLREHPEIKMADLGFMVGFGSVPPFNRHFKIRFGMTPNEYRASQKEQEQ